MRAVVDTTGVLADVLLGRVGPGSALASGETGAENFERLAVEQGVEPLLWQALAGSSDGGAVRLRDALKPRVRAEAARDLLVQRELTRVLAAMADAQLRVLVTKGAALAHTVYPEPWLRPRVDTDLLVSHKEFDAAGRVLAAAGYTRSDALSTGTLVSHQVAYERTDAHGVHHVIDLHRKIVNPQALADTLSLDELWRDARPVAALGNGGRVPSNVHSLAIACVHRLAHHQGHDRLIWLYDIKLLAAALNERGWQELVEMSAERGIAAICLDGLRAAQSRLAADLPPHVEAALAAAAPGESTRAYVDGQVNKRDVLLTDIRLLPTWTDRFRLLREHAFPPAAFMRVRYKTQQGWMLPALYAHRLLTGATRWIRL